MYSIIMLIVNLFTEIVWFKGYQVNIGFKDYYLSVQNEFSYLLNILQKIIKMYLFF